MRRVLLLYIGEDGYVRRAYVLAVSDDVTRTGVGNAFVRDVRIRPAFGSNEITSGRQCYCKRRPICLKKNLNPDRNFTCSAFSRHGRFWS